MALNSYGIEVTPELRRQAEEAALAVREARLAWLNFEDAATGGDLASTNTLDHLNDAAEESSLDLTRLLS